jgi:apolipoprotein N-acyltransferase
MTQSSAEKFANVVIGAAAVAAAYYVLRTPQLRRAAWRLGVAALTGSIPAWVSQEIRNSWEATGVPGGEMPARAGRNVSA